METLEKTDKQALVLARQQLHQAVQIPAATGRSLLPHREDDSYANLEWVERHQALASNWFGTSGRYRTALQVDEFKLLLLDGNLQVMGEFPLNQHTQQEAISWLKHWLDEIGLPGSAFHMRLPYEIPAYPTGQGQSFAHHPKAAFSELSKYFAITDETLKAVTKDIPGASTIRCWPHHFDISTLITLVANDDPEKAKTVSAGLSPGDTSYDEPYFFITPWPYPDPRQVDFPDLGSKSCWHTKGWVGSVLTATTITETHHTAEAQTAQIHHFFKEGIPKVKGMIA